jgi:putative membrane protein
MTQPPESIEATEPSKSGDRVRDHLANERTFLAWVRTGVALVVFGFAIGRFAIAIRQFMQIEGRSIGTLGLSVWFGTFAIVAGVALIVVGWTRYRRTRTLIESGGFEPAGFVIDFVGMLVALAGIALAFYLVYVQLHL